MEFQLQELFTHVRCALIQFNLPIRSIKDDFFTDEEETFSWLCDNVTPSDPDTPLTRNSWTSESDCEKMLKMRIAFMSKLDPALVNHLMPQNSDRVWDFSRTFELFVDACLAEAKQTFLENMKASPLGPVWNSADQTCCGFLNGNCGDREVLDLNNVEARHLRSPRIHDLIEDGLINDVEDFLQMMEDLEVMPRLVNGLRSCYYGDREMEKLVSLAERELKNPVSRADAVELITKNMKTRKAERVFDLLNLSCQCRRIPFRGYVKSYVLREASETY